MDVNFFAKILSFSLWTAHRETITKYLLPGYQVGESCEPCSAGFGDHASSVSRNSQKWKSWNKKFYAILTKYRKWKCFHRKFYQAPKSNQKSSCIVAYEIVKEDYIFLTTPILFRIQRRNYFSTLLSKEYEFWEIDNLRPIIGKGSFNDITQLQTDDVYQQHLRVTQWYESQGYIKKVKFSRFIQKF